MILVHQIQEFHLQNQLLGIENTNSRMVEPILIGITVNLNQKNIQLEM